jgi:hypothetical protein
VRVAAKPKRVLANNCEFSANTLNAPAVPRFALRPGDEVACNLANISLPQTISHFGFLTARVCSACDPKVKELTDNYAH